MRTKGKAKASPFFALSGLSNPTNGITAFSSESFRHVQVANAAAGNFDCVLPASSITNKMSSHSLTRSVLLGSSGTNVSDLDPADTSAWLSYSTTSRLSDRCSISTVNSPMLSMPHVRREVFQIHLASVPHVLTHSEYRSLAVLRYRKKKEKRSHNCLNRKPQTMFPVLLDHTQEFGETNNHSQEDISLVETQSPSISGQKKLKTKTLKRKRTVPIGRQHLEFIAQAPSILDSVPDCRHCGAKKFPHETANLCCSDGDVTLVQIAIPNRLRDLLLNPCASAPRSFKVMIRAYNYHLAFTSLGIKYDKKLAQRNKGVYTFRVQGQVYHWINDLEPNKDAPKNLQFYFHDTEYELTTRMSVCPDLDQQTLKVLLDILTVNPYARFFRNLSTIPCLDEHQIILKHNPTVNSKTYSKPTVSQVAVLLAADETSTDVGHKDIRVYKHSGESKTIQYYFGCYDPLQYPLMFPYGDPGWHQGIPRNGVKKRKKRFCPLINTSSMNSPNLFTNVDEILRSEEEGSCSR